ncbi:MAG: hypothetical protein V1817_04280 [Candidatus Micrarchaeota archaeon]
MFGRIFLLYAFLILASSLAYATSYNLVLKLENGSVTLGELGLVEANSSVETQGEYVATLISFKGAVLFEKHFDFGLVLHAPPREWFDENGTQIVNKSNQTISQPFFAQILIPYFVNGKSIDIYRNSTKLNSFSVSKYAACNENGVCEPTLGENYGVCSTDCSSGSKDGLCDGVKDGKCDPDCLIGGDSDCKLPEANTSQNYANWFVMSVIIIFLFIFVLVVLKLFKKI